MIVSLVVTLDVDVDVVGVVSREQAEQLARDAAYERFAPACTDVMIVAVTDDVPAAPMVLEAFAE